MPLERAQRKFLRYASFILSIHFTPYDYILIAKLIDPVSLADRIRMLGNKYLKWSIIKRYRLSYLI